MILDLDGSYQASAESMTPRQRASILQISKELSSWAAAGDTASRLAAVTRPGLETIKPVAAPAPDGGLPPVKLTPQVPSSQPPTVKPASVEMGDIFANVISPEPKTGLAEEESPKSIVAQVNEILQEVLPKSPFRDRSIKLLEIPGRGMLVMVDGQGYEGVGDVPDPQVRQLIQNCVSEWEKRS